jgi:hypothetical protein
MNSPLRYLPRLLSGRRVGGNRAVYEVFWGTGEVAVFPRVFDGYAGQINFQEGIFKLAQIRKCIII